MVLLKFGPLNLCSERWLDALNIFESIVFVVQASERNNICDALLSHEKTKFIFYRKNFVDKILRSLFKKLQYRKELRFILDAFLSKYSVFLYKLFFDSMKKLNQASYECNVCAILFSYNDFDNTNIATVIFNKFFHYKYTPPIIRAYKEHRCMYNYFEKKALEAADGLIFPSNRNRKFFEEFYNISNENVEIADEDWRLKETMNLKVELKKLSEIDKHPHLVILSGQVTYDSTAKRHYSRYNYVDMIKELVNRDIHVHLHTFRMVKNIDNPITEDDNPYFELEKLSSYFHIHQPIDLSTESGRQTLSRYDAGILHNYVRSEPIAKFTTMNVPNRLFEYFAARVMPIVKKHTLRDVEDIVEEIKFGIIYEDYTDLREKLFKVISIEKYYLNEEIRKYTFENYAKKLKSLAIKLQTKERSKD